MNQNPLERYFRQPKVYITLPSLGVYTDPDAISGSAENIAVYGMTGMDEIIIKTPDALMSGESSIKVIESCCPSIKNAGKLSTIDTPTIFAAIRIATYGNKMKVSHTCSKCDSFNEYELDLMAVIESFANKKYNNRVVVDDLVIKVKPVSYQQSLNFNIRNFQAQQKLSQIEKIEKDEEKQVHLQALWKEIADIQQQLYKQSIESIELPDQTVTERGYIEEWLDNCESTFIKRVKERLFELKTEWDLPAYSVTCDNCGEPAELRIEIDYSNFFSGA